MRLERERSLVWYGAMLPHLKKPPSLEQFTGHKPDKSELKRRWVETWDKIDRALERN